MSQFCLEGCTLNSIVNTEKCYDDLDEVRAIVDDVKQQKSGSVHTQVIVVTRFSSEPFTKKTQVIQIVVDESASPPCEATAAFVTVLNDGKRQTNLKVSSIREVGAVEEAKDPNDLNAIVAECKRKYNVLMECADERLVEYIATEEADVYQFVEDIDEESKEKKAKI